MKGYITTLVCSTYLISKSQLFVKSKPDRKNAKEARQLLCYWYRHIGFTTAEITKLTGFQAGFIYDSISRIQQLIDVKDRKIIDLINLLEP